MDIENNNKDIVGESLNQKRKQKAGLNAVRPDDYVETKFKEMAKDKNISQTDMFNQIFWSFIQVQKNENKNSVLNVESEIDLISKDLNNILINFKSIADKAQNTIISIETNAEQTEKNLKTDIDTLNKKNQELLKRNEELEQSNTAFNEIKANLKSKIEVQEETIINKNKELQTAADEITNKDRKIKELQLQLNTLERSNLDLQKDADRVDDELNTTKFKLNNLEQTNASLNSTINTLETLKKSEFNSIESKYNLEIAELEAKLKAYEETKEKEIAYLKEHLKIDYEAKNKLSIAEMKLELADLKCTYAETLNELNAIKKYSK